MFLYPRMEKSLGGLLKKCFSIALHFLGRGLSISISFSSVLQQLAQSDKKWDGKILIHRRGRKVQTIAALSNLHTCMVYQISAFELWFICKTHGVTFWLLLYWNYSVNMLYKMFWSLKIKKACHLLRMPRICIANIHACWNSHIPASYSTLHI